MKVQQLPGRLGSDQMPLKHLPHRDCAILWKTSLVGLWWQTQDKGMEGSDLVEGTQALDSNPPDTPGVIWNKWLPIPGPPLSPLLYQLVLDPGPYNTGSLQRKTHWPHMVQAPSEGAHVCLFPLVLQ